jgi:hypothetical protein
MAWHGYTRNRLGPTADIPKGLDGRERNHTGAATTTSPYIFACAGDAQNHRRHKGEFLDVASQLPPHLICLPSRAYLAVSACAVVGVHCPVLGMVKGTAFTGQHWKALGSTAVTTITTLSGQWILSDPPVGGCRVGSWLIPNRHLKRVTIGPCELAQPQQVQEITSWPMGPTRVGSAGCE